MNSTINIPEPCSESWESMKNAGSGKRHCEVCKHVVHDFTKCSRDKIDRILVDAKAERICGRYHERHTSPDNKFYLLLNRMEGKLAGFRMRTISLMLVTVLLFLSGCYRRHVQGRMKIQDTPHSKAKLRKEARVQY